MKRFGLAVMAAALGFLLTACDSTDKTEAAVKKAVLAGLKDPDSAKFGTFKLVTSDAACIVVNARNAYGGYGGDQQALVMKLEGEWFLVSTEPISQELCIHVATTLSEKRAARDKKQE